MFTRRKLGISLPLAALCTTATRSVAQNLSEDNTLPLPDPKTFEAGDLVWPKRPGVYVPYLDETPRNDPKEEERRWIAERDRFVADASTVAPHLTAADIERLRTMSFREFYARYVGDQIPDTPGAYASGGGIYVGHVGIIDIAPSGKPWVIEALNGAGVVQHSYEDWLKGRPNEIVWHGRVRNQSEDLAKIAIEAKKYLGRPYNFWNFDLADSSGFYCSKLAWLSIRDALDFAIDGNEQPKRRFWFSPKQLLYLKTIARLHDPSSYGNG
jgi:hypothetical protein